MIAAQVSGFPAKAGFGFQLFQYAFLTPETRSECDEPNYPDLLKGYFLPLFLSFIQPRQGVVGRCTFIPFSFDVGRWMLDVRPARNALKSVWGKCNHLIYISMFTPTPRTMHGRRVFILLCQFSVVQLSQKYLSSYGGKPLISSTTFRTSAAESEPGTGSTFLPVKSMPPVMIDFSNEIDILYSSNQLP